VNQLAAYHVEYVEYGVRYPGENHFPASCRNAARNGRDPKGVLYGSLRPGLGIDINEEMAAK